MNNRSVHSSLIKFINKIAAPGIVTSLSITELTPNNITLSWEPPIDCAECVQYYKITWSENEETTTDTFYTLVDLEPCENFTIYVSAVGETGEESDSSDISTVTETDSKKNNFCFKIFYFKFILKFQNHQQFITSKQN